MNLRTRISDLFRSKKIRSTSLAAIAAVSWLVGSGIPEAVVTEGPVAAISAEWVESANAQTAWTPPAAASSTVGVKTADGSTTAATAANGIIEVVMMIFLPATILAGWLLSPDWTFGEIFGLRPIIHQMWVLVSNVVYVIFAFLLIALAFMNIFWSGEGSYAIKKALPRFVTGILIVPFTWFVVSATLSVTNLLTASILRLPADMISSDSKTEKDKNEMIFTMPKECTLNFDKLSKGESKDAAAKGGDNAATAGKFFECPEKAGTHDLTLKDALASDNGAYGILNLYAYDIFKVGDIKKINGVNLKSIGSVVDMVITVGLWGIFLVVYALLVIALVFALFTRAFYLWVIAIFSPLFGLFYYLEGKGKLAESLKNISFTSFLSLALVPVYVSAALAFGILFIKKAETTQINPKNSTFFADGTASDWGKEWEMTFKMGPNKKETSIKVNGFPIGQWAKEATAGATEAGQGTVKLASSALGKIIIQMLAIIVLWMSVMVALKSSDITKEAVAPIAQFWSSMGKLAMDMPKYMPIPLGKDKDGNKRSLSMHGIWSMGWSIKTAIESAAGQKGGDIGREFGEAINRWLWMQMGKAVAAMSRVGDRLAAARDPVSARAESDNLLRAAGEGWIKWVSDLFSRGTEKTHFLTQVEKIPKSAFVDQKAGEEAIKELKSAPNATAFAEAYGKLYRALGWDFNARNEARELDELIRSWNRWGDVRDGAAAPPATPAPNQPAQTPPAAPAPNAPGGQPQNPANPSGWAGSGR